MHHRHCAVSANGHANGDADAHTGRGDCFNAAHGDPDIRAVCVHRSGYYAPGRTDREIAEELIISVRTVTTHVGNILNKTGAANRTEAAIYASQRDLVSPNSDGDR